MPVSTRSTTSSSLGISPLPGTDEGSSSNQNDDNQVTEEASARAQSQSSGYSSQSKFVTEDMLRSCMESMLSEFKVMFSGNRSQEVRDVPTTQCTNENSPEDDEQSVDTLKEELDATKDDDNENLDVQSSQQPCAPFAIPINQINPPSFSGERSQAREWLQEYDTLMEINGFSDDLKLKRAHAYLQSKAKNWHIVLIKRFPKLTWSTYKKEFVTRFCGPDDVIQTQKLLDRATQKTGQDPSEFAEYVLNLCFQVNSKMPEHEQVRRITTGLNPSIRNTMIAVRPTEKWSLDQVMGYLTQYEQPEWLVKRDNRETPNRVQTSGTKKPTSAQTPRNLADWVCFNCDGKGHTIEQCKKPINEEAIKAKKAAYRASKDAAKNRPPSRESARLNSIQSGPKSPSLPCDSFVKPVITLKINNIDVDGRVDSGADMSVVPRDVAATLNLTLIPWDQPPLRTASTEVIPVGMSSILVNYNNTLRSIIVAVFPEGLIDQPLWGLDLLHAFNLLKLNKPPTKTDVGTQQLISLNLINTDQHPIDKIPSENLDVESRDAFSSTLTEFADVFSRDETDIGRTSTVKHRIHLVDDKPVARQPYRPPIRLKNELQQALEHLKTTGAIRESKSPYAAPVFFVDKDHGKGKRLVADYRYLNAKTVRDMMPMPHPEDVFTLLSGMRVFAKLDITAMFNQIQIDERDIEKTAITTTFGLFECPLMPFGLVNAPATAVRLMKEVLRGLDGETCFVYFDDVIVFASDLPELVQRCQQVLLRLREHNLKLKPSKCHFGAKSVCYLGQIVSAEGTARDPRRIDKVKNFPIPRNPSDVRSFLGLVGYNRKFIKDFAHIAKPLTLLSGKPSEFIWSAEAQVAFETLRDKIIDAPVLVHFNPNASHELRTDASGVAMGAVLWQKSDETSQTGVVLYWSKTFNQAQRRYSATHRELQAAFSAIIDLQHYLHGKKFTLVTDHTALSLLKNQNKDPHHRLARMVAQLQGFDFDVVYKAGSLHSDADCMSRLVVDTYPDEPTPDLQVGDSEIRAINAIVTSSSSAQPQVDVDMATDQRNDAFCKPLIETLESTQLTEAVKLQRAGHYTMQDGILYRKAYSGNLLVVIPARRRATVLTACHDLPLSGHLGFSRTYGLVKQRCYWPKMRPEVKRYVASCLPCQRRKISNKRRQGFIQEMPIAEDVFDIVGIDLITKLPKSHEGYNTILVCTDNLSKYAITVPLKNELAETIIHAFFNNVIAKHGCPKVVISDRGANISGERSRDFFRLFAIKRRLTSAYHPESNGQTERFNRTLKTSLTMYVDENQRNWSDFVQAITFAYNITIHDVTKVAPFEALFGRAPRIPLDNIIEREQFIDPSRPAPGRLSSEDVLKMKKLMKLNHNKNKHRLDSRLSPPSFAEGDLVLIERPTHIKGVATKLQYTYIGPYRIVKKLSDVSYAVANIRGHSGSSVIHAWHLRPFIARPGDVAADPAYQSYVPPATDTNAVLDNEEASDDEFDIDAPPYSPLSVDVAAFEEVDVHN